MPDARNADCQVPPVIIHLVKHSVELEVLEFDASRVSQTADTGVPEYRAKRVSVIVRTPTAGLRLNVSLNTTAPVSYLPTG